MTNLSSTHDDVPRDDQYLERWIFQEELKPYYEDRDEIFDLDCNFVAGESDLFDGMTIMCPVDAMVELYFKKDGKRWLVWAEDIGWYKEEYREIVLDKATVGEIRQWISYNSVFGPIEYV